MSWQLRMELDTWALPSKVVMTMATWYVKRWTVSVDISFWTLLNLIQLASVCLLLCAHLKAKSSSCVKELTQSLRSDFYPIKNLLPKLKNILMTSLKQVFVRFSLLAKRYQSNIIKSGPQGIFKLPHRSIGRKKWAKFQMSLRLISNWLDQQLLKINCRKTWVTPLQILEKLQSKSGSSLETRLKLPWILAILASSSTMKWICLFFKQATPRLLPQKLKSTSNRKHKLKKLGKMLSLLLVKHFRRYNKTKRWSLNLLISVKEPMLY